jgi:L-cysteine S-thiosulfotransferase
VQACGLLVRSYLQSLRALLTALLIGCVSQATVAQHVTPKPFIAKGAVRSGSTFTSTTIQAQQKDDDLNPGMLWVDQGRELFAKDCASCHADATGMASKLPRLDANGSVTTLEMQINRCQVERVKKPAHAIESQALLSLATYLAFSSRGQSQQLPANVTQSAAWQRAHNEFTRVQGKLDFDCRSCHDKLYGKRVRNQAISQGYGVGYPAYRIEWQTLGSLNRRLRACFFGMETTVPAASDPILADLELYLVWRAQGLPIEAPAVRR